MPEEIYERESDIARMFREEVQEKKVIGHSASKRTRGGGRRVTMTFEMLKGKAKKDYCGNGKVKTYFLSEDELKLYRGEIETMTIEPKEAVAADMVIHAIREFIKVTSVWEGTATELLELLERQPGINPKAQQWPKAPHALTRHLNQMKSALADVGIHVDCGRGKSRTLRISRLSDDHCVAVETGLDITWQELKRQPAEEQKRTMQKLISEHRTKDLAKKLGVAEGTLWYRRKKLGIKIAEEPTVGCSVQKADNRFERAELRISCKGQAIRYHIENLLHNVDPDADYSLSLSIKKGEI